MGTIWTHDVAQLAGNSPIDTVREFEQIHVPVGSTLKRSIIVVSIAEMIQFTPDSPLEVFAPVCWYVGDLNSDISPHPSESTPADGLEGIPVLAHGQVTPEYAIMGSLIGIDGVFADPTALDQGTINLQAGNAGLMYVFGGQEVDSRAQRRFLDDHPVTIVSIQSAIAESLLTMGRNPRTVMNVRQLWEFPG